MARKSKITASDLQMAKDSDKLLRDAQKLHGRAAVAHRLGISMSCLSKYLSGEILTIEAREQRKPKMARDKRHTPIGYRGQRELRCTLGAFDGTNDGFAGHTNRGAE